MKSRRREHWLLAAILITSTVAFPLFAQRRKGSQAYNPIHSLELRGTASGGELVLAMPPMYWNQLRVKTHKGESADVVARRLFAAIKESDAEWMELDSKHAKVENGTIFGLRGEDRCGKYLLTGTETGLGIPPPPKSVTPHYDFEKDLLRVFWENGKGIDLTSVYCGHSLSTPNPAKNDGNIRSYPIINVSKILDPGDLTVTCTNYHGRTPSCASVVRMNGSRLEEFNTIPFPGGAVAPIWTSYVGKGAASQIEFRQGVQTNPQTTFPRWLYYQRFAAKGKEDSSHYRFGVWRKFLALQPGTRYRLSLDWFCHSPAPKETTAQFLVHCSGLRNMSEAIDADFLTKRQAHKGVEPRLLLRGKVSGIAVKETTQDAPPGYADPVDIPQWRSFRTGVRTCQDIVLPAECRALLVWVELRGKNLGDVEAGFNDLVLEELPTGPR